MRKFEDFVDNEIAIRVAISAYCREGVARSPQFLSISRQIPNEINMRTHVLAFECDHRDDLLSTLWGLISKHLALMGSGTSP
jgi:hypothetical protein